MPAAAERDVDVDAAWIGDEKSNRFAKQDRDVPGLTSHVSAPRRPV
jgi:hypothetical protein